MGDTKTSKFGNSSFAISKMCRLCGTKDGPYLNIFGPGMDLAKKIEDLLLILVTEWDDLPHKICFRCSAKVADFHEFLDKCIKTQENLSSMLGKDFNYKRDKSQKVKNSWEAKLNKNKLSNDEYCDELVKKALESVATLNGGDNPEVLSAISTLNQEMSSLKTKKVKINLTRVDCSNYPGVENKDGHFYLKNKPTPLNESKKKKKVGFIENEKDEPISQEKHKNESKVSDNIKKIDSEKSLAELKIALKNKDKAKSETPEKKKTLKDKMDSLKEFLDIKSVPPKIPDNFNAIKVSSVGQIYTCNKCDHLILEKEKLFTHKCSNVKHVSTVDQVSSSNSITSLPKNNPPDEKSKEDTEKGFQKPCPARRKRKSEWIAQSTSDSKSDNVIVLKKNTSTSTQVSDSPNSNAQPSVSVSNQSDNVNTVTPNLPIIISNSNSVPLQLSNSYYLVPSGNNSFMLQMSPYPLIESTQTNEISNPTISKVPFPASAVSESSKNSVKLGNVSNQQMKQPNLLNQQTKRPNLSNQQTKQPNLSNQQTKQPILLNQQKKPSNLSNQQTKQPNSSNQQTKQPTFSNQQTRQSNGRGKQVAKNTPSKIQTIQSVSELPTNQKPSSPNKNSLFPKSKTIEKVVTSSPEPEPKRRRLSLLNKNPPVEVIKKIATKPSAPYPIGLLCRNPANNDIPPIQQHPDILGNSFDRIPQNSEKQIYPQYTILPPKTPGKIVIATVSNKKNIEPPPNTPKKRGRKPNVPVQPKVDEPVPTPQISATVNEVQNQHFFTYVNLDPMLRPSYVLPNEMVQEPQLSTTTLPNKKPVAPEVQKSSEAKPSEVLSKYVCSICDLQFSREKKLHAHVKTHFEGFYNE